MQEKKPLTTGGKIWHPALFILFFPLKSIELLLRLITSKIKEYVQQLGNEEQPELGEDEQQQEQQPSKSKKYSTIARILLFFPYLLFWPNGFYHTYRLSKWLPEFVKSKWFAYAVNIAFWTIIAIFLPPVLGPLTLGILNSAPPLSGFLSSIDFFGIGLIPMFNMFFVAGYTMLYNLFQWAELQFRIGVPTAENNIKGFQDARGGTYEYIPELKPKKQKDQDDILDELLKLYPNSPDEQSFGALFDSACNGGGTTNIGLDPKNTKTKTLFEQALEKKHLLIARQILTNCVNFLEGNADAKINTNAPQRDLEQELQTLLSTQNFEKLKLLCLNKKENYEKSLGMCGIQKPEEATTTASPPTTATTTQSPEITTIPGFT